MNAVVEDILARLQGSVLTREEADAIIAVIEARVR